MIGSQSTQPTVPGTRGWQSYFESLSLVVVEKLLFALLVGAALLYGKSLVDDMDRKNEFFLSYSATLAEKELDATEKIWNAIYQFRYSVHSAMSGGDFAKVADSVQRIDTLAGVYGVYFGLAWAERIRAEIVFPVVEMSRLAQDLQNNEELIREQYENFEKSSLNELSDLRENIRKIEIMKDDV